MAKDRDPLGNAPAGPLLRRVRATLRDGVTVARAIGDYEITVNDEGLPDGVDITRIAVR